MNWLRFSVLGLAGLLICAFIILKKQLVLKFCIDQNLGFLVEFYSRFGGDPYVEIVPGTDLVLYTILNLNDSKSVLSQLVKDGLDINHRSYGGTNYLMLASFNLYPESIDLLCDFGIDLTAIDDRGSNFLAYLPGKGSDERYLLKYLSQAISKGLDPCSLSRDKQAKNYEVLAALGYKDVSIKLKESCMQKQVK